MPRHTHTKNLPAAPAPRLPRARRRPRVCPGSPRAAAAGPPAAPWPCSAGRAARQCHCGTEYQRYACSARFTMGKCDMRKQRDSTERKQSREGSSSAPASSVGFQLCAHFGLGLEGADHARGAGVSRDDLRRTRERGRHCCLRCSVEQTGKLSVQIQAARYSHTAHGATQHRHTHTPQRTHTVTHTHNAEHRTRRQHKRHIHTQPHVTKPFNACVLVSVCVCCVPGYILLQRARYSPEVSEAEYKA